MRSLLLSCACLALLGGFRYALADVRPDRGFGPGAAERGGPVEFVAADDKTITLEITGIPDDNTRKYILDKVPSLADKGSKQSFSSRSKGNTLTITMSPVGDADAFAKKIDFGTVDKIDGRVLSITAKKVEGSANPSPLADSDPLARLFADLKSANGFTRDAAVSKLMVCDAKQRSPEAAKALVAMMGEKDAGVRISAIRLTGIWGNKESVPDLIKLVDSEQADTRGAAILALGRCRDPKTIEIIAKKFAGPDRGMASKALQAMGPAAESAVIPFLKDKDFQVAAEACNVLKVIGSKDSVGPLQELLVDQKSFLFRSAVEDALDCAKGRAESAK
jgi:HEAT repeats